MGEFSTIFSGGTVQFNSGTVSGTTGFDEVDLTLAGGSIQGCKTGIKCNSRLHISGPVNFSGNETDIQMDSGSAALQIDKGFTGSAKIKVSDAAEGKQITAASTDTEDPHYQSRLNLTLVSTAGYSLDYDFLGRYWYLTKGHTWEYTPEENRITATCTQEGCIYRDGVVLTVNAAGGAYNGKPYAATVSNDITAATGAVAAISYSGTKNDGTTYGLVADPPTDAGSYKVSVTLTPAEGDPYVIEDTFEIMRRSVEIIADPAGKTYGETDPQLTWHTEDTVAQAELGEDDIAITREAGEDADAYTITPSAKDTANKNYSYIFKTADFTIKKAAQQAPTVQTVDETIKGRGDGKLTGLTAAMEYRAEGDTAYSAVTGEEMTDLAAGTYYVRCQEDPNHTVSPDTTAVIAEGKLAQIILPPDQKGYTLTASRGEAAWGEEGLLTLTLAPGYSKTANFALKVNGAAVTLDEDNTCTLKDLEADAQVTVEGVADIIAPRIFGVETDGVYTGSATFTVEDEYLTKVTVDGEPVFEDDGAALQTVRTFTLLPDRSLRRGRQHRIRSKYHRELEGSTGTGWRQQRIHRRDADL